MCRGPAGVPRVDRVSTRRAWCDRQVLNDLAWTRAYAARRQNAICVLFYRCSAIISVHYVAIIFGLDSSTQSLSGIIIDLDARRVVAEASLNFDKTLPQYKTHNGTLRSSDPLAVHSPPLLWVEALDALFAKLKTDGVALGDILAIAGSGQQHGSVYLNRRAAPALESLNPNRSLKDNLAGVFARETAPIGWTPPPASNAPKFAGPWAVCSRPRRRPAPTRLSGLPAADSEVFQARPGPVYADRHNCVGEFVHGVHSRR